MKILITQETDWLKRGPHQQHHLAEMLAIRGHEIRVIDYEFLWRTEGKKELFSRRQVFDAMPKIHQGAKIMVIRPGIIKAPLLHYISLLFTHNKEINRQVKEFNPDVIVGFGIINSYLANRIAKKHNIPFIYYWIDVLHRLITFKPLQPLGEMIERRALKEADKVLVINETLGDYVVRTGASAENISVLRAGINFEQFKQVVDCKVREQYNIKDSDVVLFFMGWLYNFSGLKEVALELAKEENPDVKLLIVGEGDAYEDLQKIRDKYDMQERIILTGKRPYQEIPSFVAASDVCLLPAYPHEKTMHDIVPIKIYEYMAMNKPVIATELNGVIKEFGEDNGVVYIDGPEEAVKKAIEVVSNGNLVQLGEKARKFVERNSWDNITDEFENVLKEVISR